MDVVPSNIRATLKKVNQEHVLKYVTAPDVTPEERQKLFKQVIIIIKLLYRLMKLILNNLPNKLTRHGYQRVSSPIFLTI